MPEIESKSLDSALTASELYGALVSLNKNKAPGIDGLTPEFYLKFWAPLSPPFLRMKLPRAARTAGLAIIHKGDGESEIQIWRPVSITATDYKVMAKALSNRVRDHTPHLIYGEQSYCVPGRTIFDSIAIIRDMVRMKSRQSRPEL
ncbi:hypothetical protein J437_LFUL014527, partial [Ladona fulva]